MKTMEQGEDSDEDAQGFVAEVGDKLMDIDVRFIELIPYKFRTEKMYYRLLTQIYVYRVPKEIVKTDLMEMNHIARGRCEIPPKYQTYEAYMKLIDINVCICSKIPKKIIHMNYGNV